MDKQPESITKADDDTYLDFLERWPRVAGYRMIAGDGTGIPLIPVGHDSYAIVSIPVDPDRALTVSLRGQDALSVYDMSRDRISQLNDSYSAFAKLVLRAIEDRQERAKHVDEENVAPAEAAMLCGDVENFVMPPWLPDTLQWPAKMSQGMLLTDHEELEGTYASRFVVDSFVCSWLDTDGTRRMTIGLGPIDRLLFKTNASKPVDPRIIEAAQLQIKTAIESHPRCFVKKSSDE